MQTKNKLLIIISFNLALMALEVVGGLISGSLALLSDAGHMLTDTTALLVTFTAISFASRGATPRKTFGWKRVEVLAALFNGALLAALSGVILYESVSRFFHPVEIKTSVMLAVAAVGLVGNAVGLVILRKEHSSNINIRGAYLHILGDLLSSVGVIAGALVISLTGFYLVDSILGVMIAAVIVRNAAALIMESLNILLEAAPPDLSVADIVSEIKMIRGIRDFHHVHVWSISGESRALSAHVLVDDIKTSESQNILCEVRGILSDKYNISHTTLEVECDSCETEQCYV
ncbi:MAG: cation diffusion facilitator family transporter [Endomicrobiia bacterium]|nr:cation diffusion facilitator family transporter [Endomicrobiia bacterium]